MEYCQIDIKTMLPQKTPFVFVDRIIEFNKETKTLKAIKIFSSNEYFIQGHFPNNPVIPGVLIAEALSQSCVLCGFCLDQIPRSATNVEHLVFDMKVKFHRKVKPEEQLYLQSHLIDKIENISVFKVKATNSKGEVTASGEIRGIAHQYSNN
jgi:3-hydroxyacyl-[acyl-carrier-protein] dehydratase